MRVLNRLLAASVATAVAASFLVLIPSVAPAGAAAGVHTMNVGVTTVSEGGLATVVVSLDYAPFPGEAISATVSTADGTARAPGDYTAKSQTVTFTCDGFTCGTTENFTVQTNEDSAREPNETLRVVLSNVQNATKGRDGSVTINDNETGAVPTLTISGPAAAPEGNTDNQRAVSVTLSPASNQEVTLNYATADDSATAAASKGVPDYVAITTQTLHWPAGTTGLPTEGAINTTVKGDTIAEPNEKFAVNFGSPNNAALPNNQVFVELNNDDGQAPVIALVQTEPKNEGDAGSTDTIVTVSITPAAPQTLSVNYATADGTAVKDDDYDETSGTLTIAQGQTTKTIAIPIVGDRAAEPDETYTVTLSNPRNADLGASSQSNVIVNDDFGQITTSPGAGRTADIRLFGPAGAVLGGYPAYEAAFTGGAHVARGDFFRADGTVGPDGVDEVIVGPGQNSRPLVKILNAADGAVRGSFFPYDQAFRGGVFVSAGNLDADPGNGDELVVAAGPGGGPHVRVLRVLGGGNFNDLSNGGFFAYTPGFGGGVRLAVGDMAGDVRDEIIAAPGPGGGPHVRVFGFSAGAASIAGEFMAYDPAFGGGVFVASSGKKLITGAGAGGGPHVRIFSTAGGSADGGGFYAYAPDYVGGVSVAAGNLDGDLPPEIATGAGPGGGTHVRVFDLNGGLPFGGGFIAYENFTGGVEVSIGGG